MNTFAEDPENYMNTIAEDPAENMNTIAEDPEENMNTIAEDSEENVPGPCLTVTCRTVTGNHAICAIATPFDARPAPYL
ncbi:hypothetical protein EMCRGX_G011028 [Ephydatia muelleri]